jgi:hypothetical protein
MQTMELPLQRPLWHNKLCHVTIYYLHSLTSVSVTVLFNPPVFDNDFLETTCLVDCCGGATLKKVIAI